MTRAASARVSSSLVTRRVVWFVFTAVRTLLFLVLLWLRLPIQLVCSVISVPMLFAFLFALYAFPQRHAMVWTLGTISFLSFTLGWRQGSWRTCRGPSVHRACLRRSQRSADTSGRGSCGCVEPVSPSPLEGSRDR